MDAFRIRDRLIYGRPSFAKGFVEIEDERVRQVVEVQGGKVRQRPDRWVVQWEFSGDEITFGQGKCPNHAAHATGISDKTILDPPHGHGPWHRAKEQTA